MAKNLRLSWDDAISRGIVSAGQFSEVVSTVSNNSLLTADGLAPEDSPLLYFPADAWTVTDTSHSKALQALLANKKLSVESFKKDKEHWDQVYIFHHFSISNPELYSLLHATPNAGKRGRSDRFSTISEGLRKGYPDMSLDSARGRYFSLKCELKRKDGRPSSVRKEQREWIDRLNGAGNFAFVAFGYQHAISIISSYWDLGPFNYSDKRTLSN